MMVKIIFNGWTKGMRGIPFVQLLREQTNVSLEDAMKIKERIVDNESVTILVPSLAVARTIINEARILGVMGEISN